MSKHKPCASCSNLRKHLHNLIEATQTAIARLDAEMVKPSTYERGRRVAKIVNELSLANDLAMTFGLGAKEPKK